MESKRTILVNLSLALVIAVAIAGTPSVAGTSVSGNCVSANVEEPIRLPGGELYPSGRLTLCVTSHFSPVATFHKTYIDGKLIGLLQSRRGFSEGGVGQSFVVFRRDVEGRLNLHGFATPAGSRMATYQLSAGSADYRSSSMSMASGTAAGAGTLVSVASIGPVNSR